MSHDFTLYDGIAVFGAGLGAFMLGASAISCFYKRKRQKEPEIELKNLGNPQTLKLSSK